MRWKIWLILLIQFLISYKFVTFSCQKRLKINFNPKSNPCKKNNNNQKKILFNTFSPPNSNISTKYSSITVMDMLALNLSKPSEMIMKSKLILISSSVISILKLNFKAKQKSPASSTYIVHITQTKDRRMLNSIIRKADIIVYVLNR